MEYTPWFRIVNELTELGIDNEKQSDSYRRKWSSWL